MKKVLVLTRFRGEYEPQRIKNEALELGFEADIVNYDKVVVKTEQNGEVVDIKTGRELYEYDLIVPRASSAKGKRSSLEIKNKILKSLTFDQVRRKVLNGNSFVKYPLLGKLEQGLILKQHGLPAVDFESFEAENWSEYLQQPHHFPMIVKMRFGSHGKNVRLVEDEEQLLKVAKKFNWGAILIQPVIKVRRWYRVIFLGGEILGVMKHRQKDKYKTEKLKEETKKIKPSFSDDQLTELKNICIKASKLFNCDYAGLDVAWDENKGNWVIWEINRTAQFKWFEKANPEINVARAICLWGEREQNEFMRHKSTVHSLETHDQFAQPLDKRKALKKGKTDWVKEAKEGQSGYRVNKNIRKGQQVKDKKYFLI